MDPIQLAKLLATVPGLAEAIRGVSSETPKLADIWAKFDEWSVTTKRTWRLNGRTHGRYLLKFFGDRQANITKSDVDELRAWLRAQNSHFGRPLAAQTRNLIVRSLHAMYEWAETRGIMPHNPIRHVEMEPCDNRKESWLTEEQFQKLMDRAHPNLIEMATVSFYSAMRFNEIRLLRKEAIDFANHVIHLKASDTKARRLRDVPMVRQVEEVIRGAMARSRSGYVFVNAEHGAHGKATVWGWFDEATTAASLKWVNGDKVTFHTLRHSAACNMILHGLSLAELMRIGGWSSDAVQRYLHLTGKQFNSRAIALHEAGIAKDRGERTDV
jgi:integrase